MYKNRYLFPYIKQDLTEKMVFLGGPRQVGKTTFSLETAKTFNAYSYYNWDNREDRRIIKNYEWDLMSEIILFDELHKLRNWKGFIKGEYDKHKDRYKYIVTGSSRLDVFRKGSDSLQGRYHYYCLHPFSMGELLNLEINTSIFREIVPVNDNYSLLQDLLNYGGFPEPFIKQDLRFLRRWHNERFERLVREDVRDISLVRDLANMQLMGDMLQEKVGSLFSLNSIREDLEVSYRAVSNWIDIYEGFYYAFRIYPYKSKFIRSLKKEPKLYLWDWSEVKDHSARFENMIASHLLKYVNFLKDFEGYKAELFYLRDNQKREVDFLVTVDHKPWFMIEVKLSDTNISKNLRYFQEKLQIPFVYQLVNVPKICKMVDNIFLVSADRFLAGLI